MKSLPVEVETSVRGSPTQPDPQLAPPAHQFGLPRLSRTDWFLLALLGGLPVVLFAVPAILGQPLLPGDALTQNYPLRVLAGDLLAHGHLPLWNSWNWSGTALLGGLNAGALYPGTFLFAITSPLVAWVSNEIVAYALCAVGLYLLLRAQSLVPLAAGLAAASFTFSGFMASHLRHIGLIQGTALIPWLLLALEGVASRRRTPWWWLLLCVSGGLIVLTGEPRAISTAAIVAGIYLVVLVVPRAAPRARLLLATASAVPVIFALGAVQLLTGLAFVHTSQRGAVDYAFFAHGSLAPEMLPLMVVPYLLGAYGTLDALPSYIGSYNLHEIVGYIGLLPLVALVTLPFWRPRAHAARLWGWVVMIVVGLLLAFGGNTPLGDLLAHVPLYSGQRLQSRNLCVVDFGLAGVFAWWVNAILTRQRSRRSGRRERLELLTSLLPSAAVIALVASALLAGPSLQRWLAVPKPDSTLFRELRPYLLGVLLVAVCVALFVTLYRRVSLPVRAWALVVIVAADVGLVMVNGELGFTDAATLRRDIPYTGQLARALERGGRMAVYDPQHRVTTDFSEAITSDLNIVHELLTVQGYSSVVNGKYNAATGTHTRRLIFPSALSGDIADQLDLRLLLVPPSYFGSNAAGAPSDQGAADPQLQAALAPPHWVRAGEVGPYLAYANTRALGRAWIVPATATSPAATSVAGSEVRRVTISAGDDETDTIRSPTRARLVRSVAYSEGWSARVRTSSGASTTVPARRFGLVQAVEVPAGTSTVTWSYHPPGLNVGLWLTLLAAAGLLFLGIALLARDLLARRSIRLRRRLDD